MVAGFLFALRGTPRQHPANLYGNLDGRTARLLLREGNECERVKKPDSRNT
jgi:hypothetical protein